MPQSLFQTKALWALSTCEGAEECDKYFMRRFLRSLSFFASASELIEEGAIGQANNDSRRQNHRGCDSIPRCRTAIAGIAGQGSIPRHLHRGRRQIDHEEIRSSLPSADWHLVHDQEPGLPKRRHCQGAPGRRAAQYLDGAQHDAQRVQQGAIDLLCQFLPQRYCRTLLMFRQISYIVFEVPSNLLLKKMTPRLWQSRICLSWGIVLACHAAIQKKRLVLRSPLFARHDGSRYVSRSGRSTLQLVSIGRDGQAGYVDVWVSELFGRRWVSAGVWDLVYEWHVWNECLEMVGWLVLRVSGQELIRSQGISARRYLDDSSR